MAVFDKHPYPDLVRVFKGYQGQEPNIAKYIFMGLDANFSSTTQESPIRDEILDYLSDGVRYWKRKNRHHPFLSPAYKKGDGYRYHRQFAKMELTSEYADKISFVELLECPTCGKTKYKRFRELLDTNYLRRLDLLISTSKQKKFVFIARGAYATLFKIGQDFRLFQWLPEPRKFDLNKLYTMYASKNLIVYVTTHFSDSISDQHINVIKKVIEGANYECEISRNG